MPWGGEDDWLADTPAPDSDGAGGSGLFRPGIDRLGGSSHIHATGPGHDAPGGPSGGSFVTGS